MMFGDVVFVMRPKWKLYASTSLPRVLQHQGKVSIDDCYPRESFTPPSPGRRRARAAYVRSSAVERGRLNLWLRI